MKNFTLSLIAISIFAFGCEKIVDVKINEVDPYLAVDAWLTHTPDQQVIRLTKTQSYYSEDFAQGVTDASVAILDAEGNRFEFLSQDDGNYVFTPEDSFATIGETYALEILWEGVTYSSEATLKPVAKIDSIHYVLEEDDPFYSRDYYYAEFFGTDLIGEGDTYWLKAYRNGKYLNKPEEIYVFYDAGFTEGNGDGKPFIFPIRVIANPEEEDINGEFIPPYWKEDSLKIEDNKLELNGSTVLVDTLKKIMTVELDKNRKDSVDGGISKYALDGNPYFVKDSILYRNADSLYLELHSVSADAWFFLTRVSEETNRPSGFGALFSTPPANVPTNIVPSDESKQVVGFFNISAISSLGVKLTEESTYIEQ